MLTPLGLVLALVIASPALWSAANGSLGFGAAMLRLLAAFVVVAVGTALLRRVTAPTAAPIREEGHPQRRRDDV
jgi:hypothetical protein